MIATNKIEKKVLWMILANNEVFKKKSEEEIDHIINMYHSLIKYSVSVVMSWCWVTYCWYGIRYGSVVPGYLLVPAGGGGTTAGMVLVPYRRCCCCWG